MNTSHRKRFVVCTVLLASYFDQVHYVRAWAALVQLRERDVHSLMCAYSNSKVAMHRSKGRNSSRRKPFDATQIIEAYGSKRWGTYLITEAHLSQRFLYDEDGYYHCCSVIPFPSI